MSRAAGKEGDRIFGVDTHFVVPASGGSAVLVPFPFSGGLDRALSSDVLIEDKAAATRGSGATNSPAHVAVGGSFQTPPSNRGTIEEGSATVFVDDRPAARDGDAARTCNDPVDVSAAALVASGTVLFG